MKVESEIGGTLERLHIHTLIPVVMDANKGLSVQVSLKDLFADNGETQRYYVLSVGNTTRDLDELELIRVRDAINDVLRVDRP
jgi:hypothetical protein